MCVSIILVSLTQTDAKGKELKNRLIEKVRAAADTYKYIYVVKYVNMRTTHFKDVRQDWKDSRFFLGKNKVMQLALGRNEEENYKENAHELSKVSVVGVSVYIFP